MIDVHVRCRQCGAFVGTPNADGPRVYAIIAPGKWWSPNTPQECANQKHGLACQDCGARPPHTLYEPEAPVQQSLI